MIDSTAFVKKEGRQISHRTEEKNEIEITDKLT